MKRHVRYHLWMSFRRSWARVAPFVFVPSLALIACVGDAVTPPPQPDASTDAQSGTDASTTETGQDTSVAETSVGDGNADAPVDAGVCSNAQPGNTVNLPTTGNFTFAPQSAPLKAGTYVLTDAFYSCASCSVVTASAVGGLIITISGQTVTIQRRFDLQEQGQPLQSVADRWTGTFDQLNANLSLTRECPSASPKTDWYATVPPTDAGKARINMGFASEFQVKDKSTSSQFNPTFVFTQL